MVEAGSQAKKKIKLMEFKHPKYYKELKEFGKRGDRGKPTAASPDTDQVISSRNAATAAGRRAPGPAIWFFQDHQWKQRHDPSFKPQAPSVKLSNQPVQASSNKHQAPSCKHQA